MSALYQIKKYMQYRLRAGNEHGLHSPFVYALYTEAICNKNRYYAFDEIDQLRRQLLQNNRVIDVTDLGAGSQRMKQQRKISDIARYSVVSKKYGELLFRLLMYFKPERVLELGTSLGISSVYMSKALPKAHVISIEGCPGTYSFATEMQQQLAIKNVEVIHSSFDDAFAHVLLNKKFDLVYIDGNHTYEATVRYFKWLLQHIHEDSVLIFDDIYWTPQMTKAWEEIKDHPAVTITVDLYKVGLVFFRKENKQKQHFCLRY